MVQVLFILIKLSPTFRWSLILLLPIYGNHQTLFRYNIDIASCLHNILLQFNPLAFEWQAVVSSIYKCFYRTSLKIKLCWEQKTEILRQYTWKILRISRNIKLCCHQKNWGDHQNLPFWYYRNGNSEALSFILWRAETHFKESLYFTTLDYLPGMKGWYWVIIIFNIFLRKWKYSEIFIVSFYINKIYLRTPSKVTFNESLKKGRGLNRKID